MSGSQEASDPWDAMIGWLDYGRAEAIDDVVDGPRNERSAGLVNTEKATVHLSSTLERRLAGTARRRGQTEAEAIRAALEQALDSEARPRRVLPLSTATIRLSPQRVDE